MKKGEIKIDVFCHVVPPKYKEQLMKRAVSNAYPWKYVEAVTTLTDLGKRFSIMDKYEDLKQVITIAPPAVESVLRAKDTAELSRIANDEMAEWVAKYPDKFLAAVACLPMNDMSAALDEADRAIKELGFKGVQIYTPTNDKPLDRPEFTPLYEKMCQYDLPIWIHPHRGRDIPDYRSEDHSKYKISTLFGWPYDTSVAMTRLVFSGILEKFPNLKVITHHCGGMVPFFADRIQKLNEQGEKLFGEKLEQPLEKEPLYYFHKFYGDTVVSGNTASLMCGYAFFGAEHLLFGTDMPYDHGLGEESIRKTIESIERMTIGDSEKRKIFQDNCRQLLHLAD